MENALAGWYTTAHTIEKEKTYFFLFYSFVWKEMATNVDAGSSGERLVPPWRSDPLGPCALLHQDFGEHSRKERPQRQRRTPLSICSSTNTAGVVAAHIQWITRCVSVRNKKRNIIFWYIDAQSQTQCIRAGNNAGCGNSFHNPPKKQCFSLSLLVE